MHYKCLAEIFSSVGGGPHARLAHALDDIGIAAKVHSLFTPESYRKHFKSGAIGRIGTRLASFALEPIGAFASALKASCTSSAGHPRHKPVVIATTNPFFLPHFLVATRPLHRCGVVALMYDIYPDALEVAGIDKPWLSRLMTWANRLMIRHADGVVYIGKKMRENAEERYGVNPNTKTIPTGGNQSEFSSLHGALPRDLVDWMDGRTIFSYVGNMGRMHDVETFKHAIPSFIDGMTPDERRQVGFVFAASGPGIAEIQSAWLDKYDDCIRIIDPLPDDAWADLLIKTDVALSSLTSKAYATSIPSKVQSALAAHAIQLAISPQNSDLAQLIMHGDIENDAQTPCGIVVEPGDIAQCVDALKRLAFADNDALRQGANAAAERIDLPNLATQWRAFLDDIAQIAPTPWRTLAYRATKRTFDFCAALAGLIVVSPIMAATAIGVWHYLGTPIIFRQQRPGLDEKPFDLCKFRSMKNAPDNATIDAKYDGERLTPFGKKIRSLSIDELPTLWNVLKGDMSLVGPRPLLMAYLDRYNDEQRKRQWVRPGVTGLAQVNGRNALSWEEKFAYDTYYAENASLLLDLKILFKTVAVVLKRSGIAHANADTMPEFMGTQQ